jgi:hypothetical protein
MIRVLSLVRVQRLREDSAAGLYYLFEPRQHALGSAIPACQAEVVTEHEHRVKPTKARVHLLECEQPNIA